MIIKQQLGIQTDFQIRYRHNLKTISRSINSENVKTAVKIYFDLDEFGEYQSSVTYYSPRFNQYRRPKWAEPIYLDNVKTESTALDYARQQLKDTPDVSITVELIELKKVGYDLGEVQLGNSLYLIDERMSINELARIVEIECFPYDNTRSPIVTISTVKQNIMNAIVQQKVDQKKLERTAVKQKVIYNGCTITPEHGFKAKAENGVEAFLNASEGIAILKDGIYKFYVNPEGELILDGRLYITYDSKPMLESYMDENGGILRIYDRDGHLNLEVGSNASSYDNVGGAVRIYDDGDRETERVSLFVRRVSRAGTFQLRNAESPHSKVYMSAEVSAGNMFILYDDNDEPQTSIGISRGYIGNQRIITKDLLDTEVESLKQEIRDLKAYVNEQDDWLWEEVDDLWRAMPSGD